MEDESPPRGGTRPRQANTAGNSLDPVYKALHLLRCHKYEECVNQCTELLAQNPYDQAVWYLKCRAMTLIAWVDDTDFEEEGIADVLLDENATASLPRPGTSLNRPMTQSAVGVPGMGIAAVRSSRSTYTEHEGTGGSPAPLFRRALNVGARGTVRRGTRASIGGKCNESAPPSASGIPRLVSSLASQ